VEEQRVPTILESILVGHAWDIIITDITREIVIDTDRESQKEVELEATMAL
jgi:hypothetical protein